MDANKIAHQMLKEMSGLKYINNGMILDYFRKVCKVHCIPYDSDLEKKTFAIVIKDFKEV